MLFYLKTWCRLINVYDFIEEREALDLEGVVVYESTSPITPQASKLTSRFAKHFEANDSPFFLHHCAHNCRFIRELQSL